MTASEASMPLLWHLPVSHYSEKVRWALDYKRIDHRRRPSLPGLHILAALWLTRGGSVTFPILELEGRRIADSSEAIAALEQRHPARPLFPADLGERHRALVLEEFFDEELGPHARLLPFHELGHEPELFGELAALTVPAPLAHAKPLLAVYGRTFTSARFGVSDEAAAELARAKILAALDRLEAELAAGDGAHLVGEGFSVADLTAAALFYPVVGPEGGPVPADSPRPAALERFRDGIRERPGYRWVEETYARYRHAPAPARTTP
jgi:glutathione S-transferase